MSDYIRIPYINNLVAIYYVVLISTRSSISIIFIIMQGDDASFFGASAARESRPGAHEAWPALPSSLNAWASRSFRFLLTRTGLALILAQSRSWRAPRLWLGRTYVPCTRRSILWWSGWSGTSPERASYCRSCSSCPAAELSGSTVANEKRIKNFMEIHDDDSGRDFLSRTE